MRELYFDVWAGDDLLGTSLGELTDASDKKITVVDNAMGTGSFVINRHSSQYAWVTPGPTTPEPLIRARRVPGGPFAYDSPNYIHAFFVEEGDDTLLSPDEEGGEDATRSGRGAEAILSRAIIDYEAHYSDDIVNHPYDKTALTDGQWHIDEADPDAFVNAGTPGAVLRIFLRNAGAQTPEPIPEVTHDFTVNHDSLVVAWEDGDAKWSFDVGTDLLNVLGICVNGGLYYKMFPSLLLQAYLARPGTDLSASITLTKGVDITEAGERTIHASPAKTRLLVKGTRENGSQKFRWVADTAMETVLGVRQGLLEYQATPTNAVLDKAGNKKLRDLKAQHDGPPTLGVDEAPGKEAFIDYSVGDSVAVDIPGVYTSEVARIHSITLTETDTGEVDVVVEFQGETWVGLAMPEGGTGEALACPFFVHRAYGTMRLRAPYDGIYSADGITGSGEDSNISVLPDQVNINTESGGNYAIIGVEGSGSIDMTVSEAFNFQVDGTSSFSKFYFSGSAGGTNSIVFPIRDTDPGPTASEEGQVYYNTTDSVFRWHNGTVWATFGSGGGGASIVGVILECNSPPNVGTDSGQLTFDTYYDNASNDLSGVLPSGIGFAPTLRTWICSEAGLYAMTFGLTVNATPGHAGTINLNIFGGWVGGESIAVPNPNTLGTVIVTRTVWFEVGNSFLVTVTGTTGDAILTYASLELERIGS